MLSRIIADTSILKPINPNSAARYADKKDNLIRYVNEVMSKHHLVHKLTGNNPLEIMYDNHKNHANFMENIFTLNDYLLLARTLPWVYRSYHARAFDFDYFPIALQAWSEAVERNLEPTAAEEINSVYRWMLSRHNDLIIAAREVTGYATASEGKWEHVKNRYLTALLRGEHRECIKLAETHVHSSADLQCFYTQVIQTSMYEIGSLWEIGQISIAQEHLATAITSRVMATVYPKFVMVSQDKGKVIATSAPNEFHDLGAWMVADFLEIDGWQVNCLGANMPQEDLLSLLKADTPHILAISVAMSFNLKLVSRLIAAVKSDSLLNQVKIMVGGWAFQSNPQLSEIIGADGYAPNAREAVLLAREWWGSAGY